MKLLRRVGGSSYIPNVAPRGISASTSARGILPAAPIHHNRRRRLEDPEIVVTCLGFCPWAVPSPSSLRCIRCVRQAMAANIILSRPGAVVALARKPNVNSPLMASVHMACAVT